MDNAAVCGSGVRGSILAPSFFIFLVFSADLRLIIHMASINIFVGDTKIHDEWLVGDNYYYRDCVVGSGAFIRCILSIHTMLYTNPSLVSFCF